MPIIPYLTDTQEKIDALYSNAKDCNVSYVLPGALYLRGKTRATFFVFIKQDFPELYALLQALYKTGGAGADALCTKTSITMFMLQICISFIYNQTAFSC